MNLVSRHYVDVDGRAVHYRVAGRGPLLLLLHQSPQSSADFLDLMDRWADRFTMLAPDRPGCGNSDALPLASPRFEDYARALASFMNAVGIERAPVYGFHTGATEAIALADLFPERVAAVAANGVVALTAEELADVEANYLPPFVPSWDGAHLAWLWARMREQTIFFPWHRRSAAARMRYDVPPPERLHRNALELLRRSDVYHLAYGAAFRYDVVAALRRLRVPRLITAADWDPLSRYLAPLGATVGNGSLRGARTPAEAEALAADFLAPFAALPPALQLRVCSSAAGRRFWLGDGRVLHALEHGDPEAPTLLLLHDAAERAQTVAPLAAALAECGWFVVTPDLPGHGDSSSPGAPAADFIERCAERILCALSDRPPWSVSLLGLGAGGHVALELAARSRRFAATVVVHEPHAWPAADRTRIGAAMAEVPRPDAHGGHLLYAWHRARDAALFRPWCGRRHVDALGGEPELDTLAAHERAVALLLSGESGPGLAAAAARDDLAVRIAAAPTEVVVTYRQCLPAAAALALHDATPPQTGCRALVAGNAGEFSRLLRRRA